MKAKLESYQALFDQDQRMIVLGNRVNELAESYFLNGKKRTSLLGFYSSLNLKRKAKKQSLCCDTQEKRREEKAKS